MTMVPVASGLVVVGVVVEGGEALFFTHFPFLLTWLFLHFLAFLCFLALVAVFLLSDVVAYTLKACFASGGSDSETPFCLTPIVHVPTPTRFTAACRGAILQTEGVVVKNDTWMPADKRTSGL